jgi:hypothetical protein
MLWEISEERRVNPPSEIYQPGDLLLYTLRGISRKFALLLGQCSDIYNYSVYLLYTSVYEKCLQIHGLLNEMGTSSLKTNHK